MQWNQGHRKTHSQRTCQFRERCSEKEVRRTNSEFALTVALAARVLLRRDLLEITGDQLQRQATARDEHDQTDPPVPDLGGKHALSVASEKLVSSSRQRGR